MRILGRPDKRENKTIRRRSFSFLPLLPFVIATDRYPHLRESGLSGRPSRPRLDQVNQRRDWSRRTCLL